VINCQEDSKEETVSQLKRLREEHPNMPHRKWKAITAEGGVGTLGPELDSGHTWGVGVLATNGCIYFPPKCARRVLCISAEGSVESLGPEILGWMSS